MCAKCCEIFDRPSTEQGLESVRENGARRTDSARNLADRPTVPRLGVQELQGTTDDRIVQRREPPLRAGWKAGDVAPEELNKEQLHKAAEHRLRAGREQDARVEERTRRAFRQRVGARGDRRALVIRAPRTVPYRRRRTTASPPTPTDVSTASVLLQYLAKIVHQLILCRRLVVAQFTDAHHVDSNCTSHC